MNSVICIAVLGALMVHCAFAQTVHIVGDNVGWDVPPSGASTYTNWASGKTFAVGDTLVFNFVTNNHDVQQVPKASFDACTSDNPIGNLIVNGPANITLSSAGDHYYICTIGRHCTAGQKLAISVSGTPGANPPTTTPPSTPSTPVTPSPTSNEPDACAPTPSPSSTPTTPSAGMPPPPPPPSSSSTTLFASVVLTMASIATGVFL